MASCPKCDRFAERFNIREPREYRDIARQLIELVNQGTFLIVRASCPLEDVLKGRWPGDIVFHDLKCFACGRLFHLHADTYHGNANWTVGDVPEHSDDTPKPN